MSDSGRPVFAVPFSWDSAIGHAVELVVDHVETGLVVQIDPGRAPAAERLRQRGYAFAAVVRAPTEADDLGRRGFDTIVVDALAEPPRLADAVEALVDRSGMRLVALVLDGVLDRVSDPDAIAASAHEVAARHDAVVVASVANVAHRAVALSLLSGQFVPIGAGPNHHTRRTFVERLRRVGLVERYAHDREAPAIKPVDRSDPALSDGAQLGAFLQRTRTLADGSAESADIVGLFEVGTRDAEPLRPPSRTIAVLVPSGLGSAELARIHEQLASQSSDDFEVVPLGDAPTATLRSLRHPYAVLLSGGETLGPTWIAQFLAVSDTYPGSVIRCASLDGRWHAHDNFYGLLHGPNAPDAAFAFPTAALERCRELVRVADGRVVFFPLLLAMVATCGVVDSGVAALAVPDGWQEGVDDAAARAALDAAPFLVPVGSAAYLADLLASHRGALVRVAELEAENNLLHEQLGRPTIQVAAKASGALRRLRDRLS